MSRSAAHADSERAWDPWLWLLLAFGLALRLGPIWIDGTHFACTPGDECSYLTMGKRFAAGRGMTDAKGWLWAPAFPALVGAHRFITGRGDAIRLTQSLISLPVAVLLYRLTRNTLAAQPADAKRAARIAVAFYLLSPTQIFFAGRIWSEVIYSALLVLIVFVFTRMTAVRDVQVNERSVFLGIFALGLCVGTAMLLRGAATYLGLALGALLFLVLPKRSSKSLIPYVLGIALLVAPYSLYASRKFGGFVLNERSLGAALWLGNNHFEPVTFDWGLGASTRNEYRALTANGYPTCGPDVRGRECDEKQVRDGVAWILAHPLEFVMRAPRRISHLVNPHSFLTRHLHNGGWPWLQGGARELVIALNMIWSITLMILGALGFVMGARQRTLQTSAVIVLYHVAVTAALVGMTRFRVPLEPLLAMGAGYFAVRWRELFDTHTMRPQRWLASGLLAVLVPLIMWHAGSGFRRVEQVRGAHVSQD